MRPNFLTPLWNTSVIMSSFGVLSSPKAIDDWTSSYPAIVPSYIFDYKFCTWEAEGSKSKNINYQKLKFVESVTSLSGVYMWY